MKLVVDTNRIIAALISNGVSRKILMDENFEFVTPAFSLVEIEKHREEIQKKAEVSHEEFILLMSYLFERVAIISPEEYDPYIEEARMLINDVSDVPFVALSLAVGIGIWTDDAHFLQQKKMTIFRTKDLMLIK